MPQRTASRIAAGLVGLLLAAGDPAGCTGTGAQRSRTAGGPATTTATATTATATTRAASSPRPVTLADARRCPVTLPHRIGPPGVTPDDFFGWARSRGNGKLWVGALWPRGIIVPGPDNVNDDGSVDMKFGWWRAVPGTLRITGRRLDAAAPPARGEVPYGYGDRGFQASGVIFPTEGCWEVTGTLPTTSLTFVTFVIKIKQHNKHG